jgi:hypothetical protein
LTFDVVKVNEPTVDEPTVDEPTLCRRMITIFGDFETNIFLATKVVFFLKTNVMVNFKSQNRTFLPFWGANYF